MFAKFNTDEVRGMGSLLGITAMPTFKVFKAKVEVGCQRGWNESRAVLTMSPPRGGGRVAGGALWRGSGLRRTARA